jgi:hypothetical protein
MIKNNILKCGRGTTKKRHFRKSKKSKRTKSKSRTRRGGGLSSKDLYIELKKLQKKIPDLEDGDEKKKFIEEVFTPAVKKWEDAEKAEEAEEAAEAKAAEAKAAEAGAPASAAEIVYDGGRRSRRIATKKKYRKVRKSHRANRRPSRKH